MDRSDDDDNEESHDITELEDQDIANEQFFGSIRGEIVGLRYYHGEVRHFTLIFSFDICFY